MHNFYKISYNYLVTTLLFKTQKYVLPFVSLNFYKKKEHEKATKIRIYNKTLYVWSNKFTPAKKKLHNRWL